MLLMANYERNLQDLLDRVVEGSEKKQGLNINCKKTMYGHKKEKKPKIKLQIGDINSIRCRSFNICEVF